MEYIKSLQAGRALAAIAVVAGHTHLLMEKDKYGGVALFNSWPRVGALGVDFFFALSGFIIFYANRNSISKPELFKNYIWKRFARLYPFYWAVTIAFICLSSLGIGDTRYSTAPLDFLSYATLVHITPARAPIGVAWTLFYEVQFYVLFAGMLLNRRAGITILMVWFGLILANYATPYAGKGTAWGDLVSWMNLNFFAGMAVYLLYEKGYRQWAGSFGILGIISGGLMIYAWRTNALMDAPWIRILMAFSFGSILYAAIVLEEKGHLRIPKFLNFLGDASYSIYLVHVPILSLALKICMRLNALRFVSVEVIYFVAFTGAIAGACLAHILIERPLLHFLRRIPASKAPSPIDAR